MITYEMIPVKDIWKKENAYISRKIKKVGKIQQV